MDSSIPAATGSRTRIACGECRKNKRRCDGKRPTCTLCDKAGRACEYAPESSRKRRYVDDDLLTRLQDQVAALETEMSKYQNSEKRLGSLERSGPRSPAQIQFHQVEVDHLTSTPYVTTTEAPFLSFGENASQGTDIRSQVAMEELASLMLTMDIEGQGEPSFTITSGKVPKSPTTMKKELISPLSVKKSVASSSEPREFLVDSFMENFNPFHQFLTRNEAELLKHGAIAMSPDEEFRNHALFSVAAYFIEGPLTPGLGSKHVRLAENMLIECLRQWSSHLVVQGIALLAWRELVIGNDSMAYNYIGMATGALLHLGLHVSAFKEYVAPGDTSQASYKRKVQSFWAYFSVDKLLTSSLGMNCTIHWQRIRCQPYLATLQQSPSIDDLAHNQFCQLWHLWDSCMDQVHAFAWSDMSSEERRNFVGRSHRALEKFYSNTDERLRLLTSHSHQSVTWFQLSYHAALILIHRPFLNEPTGSSTLNFSLRSATSSAASISRIIRIFRKKNELSGLAPQIVDYILSASVIHLLNATSGRATTLGKKSAHGLKICLETLLGMDEKWGTRVQRAVKRIQELAHRWMVVWALPSCLSQPLLSDQNETLPASGVSSPFVASEHIDPDGQANLWEANHFTGALDQINTGWATTEDWNLESLFDMPGIDIEFSW